MKRIVISFLLIGGLLCFSSCVPLNYKDTNGENDFALQSITDDDILYSLSARAIMSASVSTNSKVTYKVGSLSGVYSVFEREVTGEDLKLIVSCEVSKGNARLVLVVNDEIVHDFELNEADQVYELEDVTGTVSLRLAGEKTGISVTCEFE